MLIYNFKPIVMLSKFLRRKRMRKFSLLFNEKLNSLILDVGGFLENWKLMQVVPRLILLNLHPPSPGYELNESLWVIGDGRQLPFKDNEFDIIYSNSVIEHVGDLLSQQKFAKEIDRVGVSYFIQTPYKYFFIEPHFMLPLIQFIPKTYQRMLARILNKYGLVYSEESLDSIRLLSYSDMKKLFPDAVILREKILFMTKSLIAVKI